MDAAPVPLMAPRAGVMDKAGGPPETKLPFDPAHVNEATEPPAAPEPPKLAEAFKSDALASSQPPKEGERLVADLPKSVEMKSVPDTPVNAATPAGGTPRPELKIAQEPIETAKRAEEPAKPAPAAVNGASTSTKSADGPASSTSAEAAATTNTTTTTTTTTMASSAGFAVAKTAGQKRKLEDVDDDEGHSFMTKKEAESIPAEKKRKIGEPKTEAAEPALNGTVNAADKDPTPTPAPAPKKVGRPKKQKTAPVAVGRTERKTRSQGPAIGGAL